MYAKILSTTWDRTGPARSEVVAGRGFEFEHELGCPMQGSPGPCTCYVSRIRLVKTPVGRTIPTTEPDLRPDLKAAERRSAYWKRQSGWGWALATVLALSVNITLVAICAEWINV